MRIEITAYFYRKAFKELFLMHNDLVVDSFLICLN